MGLGFESQPDHVHWRARQMPGVSVHEAEGKHACTKRRGRERSGAERTARNMHVRSPVAGKGNAQPARASTIPRPYHSRKYCKISESAVYFSS